MKTNLNRPFSLRVTTLATAISLALLAACSGKQTESKPVSSSDNKPAATSASTNPTSANQEADKKSGATDQKSSNAANAHEKVQAYIECYNSADRSGHSTIERYASWVNMKSGPTGKERHVYGLYSIHENVINNCTKEITAALEQQPALQPLDDTARAYLGALQALAEQVNEAYKYYERENYKDDGFAQGKKMHSPLVQVMEKFDAASDAFSEALEAENSKLLAEELKRVEETEGRKLRYWRMVTMAEAKQLTNLIAEDTFDVNKATAQLAEFEQAADGLTVYAKDHKDELPTSWSFMESAVEEFRIAAKERVRRVRDKKPYSQTESNWVGTSSGWMVEGSPDKLIREYNELVSRSNSTR